MENKTVSRIAIAFLCVVGLALLVFIGFIVIIVIACGQYKPPVAQEDYEMPALCLTQADSTICATLPPRLPIGSYWTDGAICYQVTRSGLTVQMEGYSMHEGGMSCTMDVVNDNTMFEVKGEEGTFATEGSPVTHHRLTDVIAYPYLNPKRISFMLTKEGLRRCGAVWNAEEEYWETDYTETGSMIRKEAPNWLGTQLFCLPMAVLMVEDYSEEEEL